MHTVLFRPVYWLATVSLGASTLGKAQVPASLDYTQVTQPGLYSVVFAAPPSTQGPLRQRNALGKWVEAVIHQVELPASAKANLAYVVTFGPDNATPASLRVNLSTIAARVDHTYDKVYGSDGTIVYSRLVTPPELAPAKLTCQEIVWRNKQGDFACLRTFYYRHNAITLAVSGTGASYNKVEVARFLYSFKPL